MSLRYFDNDVKRWVEPADMEWVRGEKPWLAELWEPLTRKVPNPCLARAYCCYLCTVIFYVRPTLVRPWHHLYRWKDGWHAAKPGQHLEEWGRVDGRITWHTAVEAGGEAFEMQNGTVVWRGKGRGWWMRYGMRRKAQEARTA